MKISYTTNIAPSILKTNFVESSIRDSQFFIYKEEGHVSFDVEVISDINYTTQIHEVVETAKKYIVKANTDNIIAMTEQTARDLNMQPYYMYRQKNMAGNFENVGYAVSGLECIYNILIMEEKQTIIACGAGASTKVVFHNEGDANHSVRIERIENVKDVRSYVERIDEMIERKRKFFEENEF